ncbi:MAG: LPS assembly protein LptD, partial [Phycisphaerales bacterium]|nr:LPS assembly protein LptD [Phycisphaerales bacterium]
IPLRDLRFENSSGSGSAVKTRWDLFALMGIDNPEWLNADLLADVYFDRGPALGAYTVWDEEDFDGSLFAYVVAYDTGEDLLRNGSKNEHDGETRGMVVGEHRWKLSDTWTMLLEGAYMSDETFVDGFFEQLAWSHREYRTGMMLRRQAANTLLSLEASGNLNDFIVTDHLLQSRGYSVEKMPEFAYHQVAGDLFPGIQEGLVTHTWEARLSRMRMDFDKQTPRNYGFSNARLANQFLGADPDESIAEALRDTGLREELVHRFDTRQEVSTSFDTGPIHFRPYVVGRLTAYDDNFSDFSPREEDYARAWGSVGIEASTTLTKVDNSVDSALFDLHRIRHTVRPSVTLWHSESTIDAVDLPVYDDDVESITEGTAVRVAVDQTWQTKRGGPGRWRDEDVFQLGVEYVHFGTDSDRQSPIARWFDWRPELSNPGEFLGASGLWKATNSLAFSGETVFDLEISQQARSSVGMIVDHGPNFSSFVELRFLNAQDSTFIDVGSRYTLSRKYAIAWIASYDDKQDDLQQVAADIERMFPNAVVQVGVRYNNITDEFSFGFGFTPRGLQGRGVRLQGIGSSNERDQQSGF